LDATTCKLTEFGAYHLVGLCCIGSNSVVFVIQEAIRTGDLQNVQLLVDHGADINARTKGQEAGASGGTPLWWARHYLDPNHEVIGYLKANGAKLIAPQGQGEDEEAS
jgi:hypothetical protein